MNRRESLRRSSLFLAGLGLAACGGGNAADEPRRKNILLVHGAWHSSLHWNLLAARLVERGHLVHAMDLPGAGLTAQFPASFLANDAAAFLTEPSPLRNLHLSDFRDAVAAQIRRMAPNGKVTLVGHSMGGVTITAAAEAAAEHVARVVYLTAYVPVTRPSAFDYISLPENAPALGGPVFLGDPSVTGAVRLDPRSNDPVYLEHARLAFYNDMSAAATRPYLAALVPDVPFNVPSEDARGTAARWGRLPRTFIRCTLDNALPIGLQDRMIAEADAATPSNRFDVRTLAASHSPFASMPDQLAATLDALA